LKSRRCAWALLAAACTLTCNAAHAADDDAPSVTPYRPTVSDPANLSSPGWIEVETGMSGVRDVDATRTATAPYLIKYAFDADHGLLLGGDAWVDVAPRHGRGERSVGDTFLAWKQRFAVNESSAFGIEAGIQAPTARDTLGIGKPAYRIIGIYSIDFGSTHLDLNAGGTRFMRAAAHASDWQSAWSAALSHPLDDAFGAALELSGSAQRGAEAAHQVLGAINYNLARRCVLDAGVAYGLDRAGHSHEFFVGATWLLGKVR
jgi:hypothetical protein